jgi:Leucine rich repeat
MNDTLPNLKVLDVSRNALTSLNESDLTGFVNLREIYLIHNHINSVSWEAFGKLNNLRIVNLRSNKLTYLVFDGNKSANCCHGITVLSLSDNPLKDVSSLSFFSGVKELYISHTNGLMLNTVPFEQLPNLTAITMENTGLTNTTDLAILETAKNLQNLSIANNNFGILDLAKFPKLPKLVYLNLQQLTLTGHLTLKTRLPELKIIKMSSDNWTCDYHYKVLEYLEEDFIEWVDKAIATTKCQKMYVLGYKILLIFVGVCSSMVVFVVTVASVIYKMIPATNNDVPVRDIEESAYAELETPNMPNQTMVSKSKDKVKENKPGNIYDNSV